MIVKRNELKSALACAGNFINTRSTTECLKHVCLRGVGGKLRLETTGRDGVCHVSIDADGAEGMLTWVMYEHFADLIRRLAGETVSLTQKGNALYIVCGRSKSSLPVFANEKAWSGGSAEVRHRASSATVLASDLCDIVSEVSFASPKFSNDFSISIYLSKEGDNLWAHAASGSVGAFTSCPVVGDDFGVAAPTDPLKRVCSSISGQESVEIIVGDGIEFRASSVQILIPKVGQGRLITPAYRAKVNEVLDSAVKWGVSRESLMEFIAVAEGFKTEDCVAMHLTPRGDHVLAEYRNEPVEGGGNAFTTGTTEMELEGTADESCPGGKCSINLMKGATANATDEDFYLADSDRAFYVCSKGYVSFVSKMAVVK